MPRDANGNYTLVAGNPVVAGTPITTSWANPTLQDVAQAMTNSLSRNGLGGMLVPFQNDDGSIGLPGITWTSETKTGLYRAGTNDMRVSVNGVDNMRWNASGTQVWNGTTWGQVVTANVLADYLPLAGGTVTGPLLVPTSSVAEEAVNNTRLADYLPLTGGTISGILNVPETSSLTQAVNNDRLNAVVAGYLPVAGQAASVAASSDLILGGFKHTFVAGVLNLTTG